MKVYGRKMTDFGEWCADQGMPLVYHHHMAAVVETEPELDLLHEALGEGCRCCSMPATWPSRAATCCACIDKHHKRISHVHTKDVRMDVIDRLDRSKRELPRCRGEGRLHRAGRRLA